MKGRRKAAARSQRSSAGGDPLQRTGGGGTPRLAQRDEPALEPAAPESSALPGGDLRPPDTRPEEHHNGVSARVRYAYGPES